MKKLISAIILTLILIQSINIQCLAQCEIPSASVKGLNLDSKILEENGFFEKELDDKFVNVTAINRIGKFISDLENKLANSYKKIVTSWNSNLNEKTIDIIGSSVKDIFSGKYGTKNADALIKGLEYLKGISTDVKLSDEEKIKTVEEGRIRSEIGMATSKGVGIAAGATAGVIIAKSGAIASAAGTVGTAAGATLGTMAGVSSTLAAAELNAVASGVSTIAATANSVELANVAGYFATAAANIQTTGTAIAATTASVATPILIAGAVVLGVCGSYKLISYLSNTSYNKYFSEKPYNEAVFESKKTGNLLSDITKSVCEHEWIGNNVLTVATSKDQR